MRILHCIPTLGGGGAERQVRLLTAEFARRGVATGLLTRFAPEDLERLRDHGVECIPLGSVGNHSLRLPLLVAREPKRGQWQIVQSWIAQMDVLVGLRAAAGDFRWVLSERSAPRHYASGWKSALRKRLGAQADLIVANSRNGLAYWSEERVAKTVIPNAIDFAAAQGARERRRRGDTGEMPLLVSIGRLDQWKNFEILVRAQKHLRERGIEARLTILGDGPLRQTLQALVGELGLADRVELAGFEPDVMRRLAQADLYVSTSLYEGQPNTVLEAAAARVPTVLSDIAEHREVMGEAAAYADPNDSGEVAGAIARLLADRALAGRNAAAAFERIENQSVQAVADRYLEWYSKIA